MQDRFIIDPESGEIVDILRYGDRIIRKKSAEISIEIEHVPKDETFTKIYHAIIPIIADIELPASSLIVFLYLACNLRYMSNVAKYRNGKLINRECLEKHLGLSEATIKRAVKSLIQYGMIVEAKTLEGNAFIVNPFIVMVGDRVNRTVFDLFRKSKWARW